MLELHDGAGDGDRVGQVVEAIRTVPRHQGIAETTLRRLARTALVSAEGDVSDAVKRTKRGLHEVYGAYLPTRSPKYHALVRQIRAAAASSDPEALRAALSRAMGQHASTRERLPRLAEFYGRLADELGIAQRPGLRLCDVACGFNPLAVPWMGLPERATYLVSDIDASLVAFVDEVLQVLGLAHTAAVRDAVPEPETTQSTDSAAADDVPGADVALLLKTVPCLERQETGAGWRAVDTAGAPTVVVTFPTRSLGQRAKGMYQTYSAAFARWAEQRPVDVTEYEVGNELVYIVRW